MSSTDNSKLNTYWYPSYEKLRGIMLIFIWINIRTNFFSLMTSTIRDLCNSCRMFSCIHTYVIYKAWYRSLYRMPWYSVGYLTHQDTLKNIISCTDFLFCGLPGFVLEGYKINYLPLHIKCHVTSPHERENKASQTKMPSDNSFT